MAASCRHRLRHLRRIEARLARLMPTTKARGALIEPIGHDIANSTGEGYARHSSGSAWGVAKW